MPSSYICDKASSKAHIFGFSVILYLKLHNMNLQMS